MAITRRATDIDLTDRFDLSDFQAKKEKKHRQDLKDIWYALDGLPAIKVTPEMIIERLREKQLVTEETSEEAESLDATVKDLSAQIEVLQSEHHELKELCWSAFEMEPKTLQSLKDWLKSHED